MNKLIAEGPCLQQKAYNIVLWPESQLLMEEEWFDECVLAPESFGRASYFVPEHRYKQWKGIPQEFDVYAICPVCRAFY